MDEIDAFFDFSKEFKHLSIESGTVSGNPAAMAAPSHISMPVPREYHDEAYATELQEKEMAKLKEWSINADSNVCQNDGAHNTCLDELDDLSDDETKKRGPVTFIDSVYSRYNFDFKGDDSLPIHDCREVIIETIRKRPVVILQGDTGCGKTTQVPQYILDDCYRRGEFCKIVVTQPRRIAAISITRRVCEERKWDEGTVVGFQVGLHNKMCEDTLILYCTTGVLLQKLIKDKNISQYTHIILDEVHERDQDMDFLLIVIRRLLILNSKNVKIILMSATIDTQLFANYFNICDRPAPIIKCDCRRLFTVREHYINDIERLLVMPMKHDFREPGISNESYNVAARLIIVLDTIEQSRTVVNDLDDTPDNTKSAVLVFLPGINEIDILAKKLEIFNTYQQISNKPVKLWPIRLHSMISPEEQGQVFHRAPAGFRKVILATNIAESSITVPDVRFVIDFCLTKCLVTDAASNFSSLQLQWASKANCRQRAGRVGRVMCGRVYRMVPRSFYENYFFEYSLPEMLRCPLEMVVLKAKLLEMGPPPDILGLALNPPKLSAIQNTILNLKEAGALYTCVNNQYSINDGNITYLGRVMASLPLDIRLGRLILLGHLMGALEDAIIIAAGLSVRSIFVGNFKNKQIELDAYTQKLLWADGSGSDLIAILKAYTVWLQMRQLHNMDQEAEYAWCRRYFINPRTIKEMHLLIQEVTHRLKSFGIGIHRRSNYLPFAEKDDMIVLKLIIAGAFYPNFFTTSHHNDNERERGIYHLLCGHDPWNTVYFTGFDSRQIGQIYIKSIKDIFKEARISHKNMEVHFQRGAGRVYLAFKPEENEEEEGCSQSSGRIMSGRIHPDVYRAVRMRLSNVSTSIPVMDPQVDVDFAVKNNLGRLVGGTFEPFRNPKNLVEDSVLPGVFTKHMRGRITHIISCSKFFFQPLCDQATMKVIIEYMKSPRLLQAKFKNPGCINDNMLVAAPFQNGYHRAKVVKKLTSSGCQVKFKVLLIDFGNSNTVDFKDLRNLAAIGDLDERVKSLPPRCFECRLAHVSPSLVRSPDGVWLTEAKNHLQEIADAGFIEIEVFSIVKCVVNIELKFNGESLNQRLVEIGIARKSEESYLSKMDHDLRERKYSTLSLFDDIERKRQNLEYLRTIQIEEELPCVSPMNLKGTKSRVMTLKGPYSPLESQVHPILKAGTWKSVNIERESVNSPFLDIDPTYSQDHLFVAASVIESQNGNVLTARSTTSMPNIPGFTALVILLFAPTVQVKRNRNKSRYTAILGGLGYYPQTHDPYYEEHDIVLNLDCELTPSDFSLINQIRYSMEAMIYTDPDQEKPSILPENHNELMISIRRSLVRLFTRSRNFLELVADSNDAKWEPMDESDLLIPKNIYPSQRCIFPLHSVLRLHKKNEIRTNLLQDHCQELHNMKSLDCRINETECLLCKKVLKNIVELRIHLLSQLHKDREKEIGFHSSEF